MNRIQSILSLVKCTTKANSFFNVTPNALKNLIVLYAHHISNSFNSRYSFPCLLMRSSRICHNLVTPNLI